MNKLTDKQKKLITDNYGLVNKFVGDTIEKSIIPQDLKDEFESDMHWKFCFSALGYNVDTGWKFSTYVHTGFRHGIDDLAKKKEKFDKIQYIDIINKDDLRALGYKENSLKFGVVDYLMDNTDLTLKERSMVEEYFYDKVSFSKLGKKYDMSKEGSRLIVKKALRKLKQTAINMNLDMEDFYS
jgi:hypothetical protein